MTTDPVTSLSSQFRGARLPAPQTSYRFLLNRRYEFSAVWPEHRIAVMLIGEAEPFRPSLHNAAVLNGWSVYYFTGQEMLSGSAMMMLRSIFEANEDI